VKRLALVIAIATTLPGHASDCTRPISCGATVARTLDFLSTSCLDSQARTYDLFAFPVFQGQKIEITASSPAFPPELLLLDPLNVQRASATNTSASTVQLPFTITQSGTWTIELRNSQVGGDGPYSLNVACVTDQPPPPQNGFTLSATPISIILGRSASTTATVRSTINGSFASRVTVHAAAPAGVTVTPADFEFAAPGSGARDVTIATSDSAVNGQYGVVFAASADSGSSSTTNISLRIDAPCSPPFIGDQPRSVNAIRGSAAHLVVRVGGSGPLAYQWYRGYSGLTSFPIANGTTATLETDPLANNTQFWVRVKNECGSKDSDTISVTATAPPAHRRAVGH
jgi:hypothetical protein